MSVKIRLQRGGAKKKPFYSVVIADARAPRDGKFIEKVGTFNPILAKDDAQRLVLKKERVEHWLSQGAVPSERVAVIINNENIGSESKTLKTVLSRREESIKARQKIIEAKKKAEAEAKEEAEKAAAEEAEEAAKKQTESAEVKEEEKSGAEAVA